MSPARKLERKPGLLRRAGLLLLVSLYAASLLAGWFAPKDYTRQYRETPNAAPSRQFLLGTDDLGRDRFSRLLTGSRVSLCLAPAASLVAVGVAAIAGVWAGLAAGWWRSGLLAASDLTLSLPLFFVLVTLRAMLPLDLPAGLSMAATFLILGLAGWAGPARVICSATEALAGSDFVKAARARGAGRGRLLACHLLPNLRPVLQAQFWTYIPVFLLAEANLGILGLGVAEPLPSWGGLLRELEPVAASGQGLFARPWLLATPAVVVICISAHVFLMLREEER